MIDIIKMAPASAEAILHPPLGERIREYAYLVAIAVVALGVGAASLVFAQPEHAGMTGTPSPSHPYDEPRSPEHADHDATRR